MITATVTTHNSTELADQISEAFVAGEVTHFGGDQIASRYGQPVARSWQNGTVSITVKARSKRGFNDRYVKVGQALTVR